MSFSRNRGRNWSTLQNNDQGLIRNRLKLQATSCKGTGYFKTDKHLPSQSGRVRAVGPGGVFEPTMGVQPRYGKLLQKIAKLPDSTHQNSRRKAAAFTRTASLPKPLRQGDANRPLLLPVGAARAIN